MTTVTEAGARTAALVERAERLFPGGVNSPVRAFRAVARPPLVLESGAGPYVREGDGRTIIDSIGAMAHGPAEIAATIAAARIAFKESAA